MKFAISENRLTGKRISYHNGRIVVETMRKPMPDDQRKMVEKAKFEPEIMLDRLQKAIEAKADNKALMEILAAKPDFDQLTT
jgi:hypothetical protein